MRDRSEAMTCDLNVSSHRPTFKDAILSPPRALSFYGKDFECSPNRVLPVPPRVLRYALLLCWDYSALGVVLLDLWS